MKTRHYLIIILLYSFSSVIYSQIISKDSLIQDIRQLSDIIETSHPDPYIKGGGKIAFHKRLHTLILSVPEKGMTKNGFQKLLFPFVAAVGDGHTSIQISYKTQDNQPGGIPLLFKIIEKNLYVAGVIDPKDEYLIGSILLSVENISYKDIYYRMTNLRGVDNEYGGLRFLADKNFLWYKEQLHDLLPEWKKIDSINVRLKLPSGKEKELTLNTNLQLINPIISTKTKINLPSTEKCEFNYGFLENNPKIAVLKIDGMGGFCENYELVGLENEFQLYGAKYYYKRFNGKEAPENKTEIVKGIPSATEKFKALVIEMKKLRTEVLIIDLRGDGGGNSTLGQFLVYYLYGKDALIKNLSGKSGYEIRKYSNMYFEQNQDETLNKLNKKSRANLLADDYWFEELDEEEVNKDSLDIYNEFDEFYKKIPTFYEEYKSNVYSKYYCPPKVIVLCSPQTYSSGFTMMKMLNEMGATLIGTPSSQAGNNAGWILNYKLNNTGLYGWVACKYYASFSEKIINGVYMPDYLFTYDKLSEYNFDPNAEIKYALELFGR
ncbi:MAG: S41 family peptidase [Bacteroidales bacterium]